MKEIATVQLSELQIPTVVGANTIVSIRYRMKNSKGEVLEDNSDKEPVQYLHGTGHILAELEVNLEGLKPGDEKQVYISKNVIANNLDDDFSFEVIIDSVRAATKEELQWGFPISNASVMECGPGCNC